MNRILLTFVLTLFSISTFGQNSNGIFENYIILNNQFYDLGASTSNPNFHNASLGTFNCTQSLTLNGFQAKVFKCNACNITSVKLYYRIYRDGTTPGGFSEYNWSNVSNIAGAGAGCQNQQWETTGGTVNILSGLSNGTYRMEVYTKGDGTNCNFPEFYDTYLNGNNNYIATFTISNPITINTNPTAPAVLCSGNSTTITSTATGADFFEWQEFNGSTWVSTSTTGNSGNASFTTPNLTSAKTYRCRFTNCGGLNEAFSNSVTITPTRPNITIQPVDAIDCYNNNINFYVGATSANGGTLTYEWYRKLPSGSYAPINSTTPPTGIVIVNPNYLRVTNIGSPISSPNNPDGTFFYCKITEQPSGCTVSSNEASININRFNTVSVSKSPLCVGEPITFTSSIASGSTRLISYQWFKNNISTGSISGANGSTYSTAIASVSDTDWGIQGNFQSNQTTSTGVTTNTTCLTSQNRTITVRALPTAPTVTNAERCGSGSIMVSASGAGANENYRWYSDNSTNSTLQVGGASYSISNLSTTTNYFVSKTLNYGGSPNLTCESAARTAVTATINPIPSITLGTIPPVCANATSFTIPYSATSGSPDKFSVSAGSPNLSGFVNVTDANLTPSILTVTKPATTAPASFGFNIKVKNNTTTCESSEQSFTLNLTQPTAITAHPQNTTVCEDGDATFNVTAIGTGTLSYQWKKGTTNVGTNSATLTLSSVALTDDGASITCEVTSDCGTVISNVATLTVNPKTKITVQPTPVNACEGTEVSFTLTATGTGTLSYQWKKGTTNVGINSNTLTLSSVSATDAGSYTCVVTGTCSSATSDPTILVVNPNPAAPTVSSITYCQNSTASELTATASGGNTLLWYGTNSMGAASTTAPTPLTTTVGETTYFVSQRDANGCESPKASIVVKIIPAVTVSITGRTNICSSGILNRTTTLTASASGGDGNYTYQWKNSSGDIASAISMTYDANAASSYSVEVKSANCTTLSTVYNVNTVAGIVTPTSISGSSQICGASGLTTLTANPTPPPLGTYHWYDSPSSLTSLSSGDNFTVNSVGTYYLGRRLTISALECESDRISTTISDGTPAQPTLVSGTSVCSGKTLTLEVNCPTGTTAQWYNDADVFLAQGATYNVTLSSDKTYKASCKNTTTNCESSKLSINVTVVALPQPPSTITGNTNICTGTSTTLTASCPSGEETKWYATATGTTVLFTGSSYSTPNLASSTTYYAGCIQTSGSQCESGSRTSVTVNTLTYPSIPTITNSANKTTFCNTESNFTLSVASCDVGSPQFRLNSGSWTSGGTVTINPSTYSTNTTFTYSFKCVLVNGATTCEGTDATTTITINASPIVSHPTDQNNCKGLTTNFEVPNNANYTYQWQRKRPTDADFISVNNTMTGISGSTTSRLGLTSVGTQNPHLSQYRVIISSNGCSVISNAATLTVNEYTSTLASQTQCQNGTVSFTVPPSTTTPVSYQWQSRAATGDPWLPVNNVSGKISGATSSSLTINNLTASDALFYRCDVIFNRTIGTCSEPTDDARLTVTVINPPTVSPANVSICNGASTTLTATGCTGTLAWSSGQTTSSITVSPTANTNYTATCTQSGCTSNVSNTAAVEVKNKPEPPTISGDNTICTGQSATLTATGCAGDITWNTGATTTQITVTPTSNASYSATCRVNGCESDASTTWNLTVNAKPNSPINTTTTPVCEGNTLMFSATGSNLLWYEASTGGVGTTTTPSFTIVNSYSRWVSQTINNCESDRLQINASITSKPQAPVANGTTICSGTSATLTISNACSGTLTWYKEADNSVVSMPVSPTVNTNYYAKCSVGNCESDASNIVTVSVNTIPAQPTNTTVSVCFGNTLTFSASGSNLLWYSSATGGVGSSTAPSYTEGGTYTHYVSQTLNGCESSRLAISESVKKITISTQPTNQNNCDGNSVSFSISASYNLTGTLTYQWQRKKPSDADFVNITNATNSSLSIADAGVGEDVHQSQYRCVVSVDGCSITSDAATLTVNKLSGTLSSQTVCAGTNVVFNLNSLTITGNIVSYQWQKRVGTSGSFVDIVNETNATLNISNVSSADNNTYYKCRITFSSSSGTCSRLTDDARLTVNSVAVGLTPTPIVCNGEVGQIVAVGSGGSTPYTYSRDGVSFQSSGTFAGLVAGTYTITAKDNIGCTATSTVTITEPPALTMSLTPNSVQCSGGTDGTITVTAGGGTPAYQYSKDGTSFQSGNEIVGLSAGTYTITVKDANGCTTTATTSISAGQVTTQPTN
ncbi:MAG: immunoglobulin domain-containing protein, partial [Spirosomataceae bacterium]